VSAPRTLPADKQIAAMALVSARLGGCSCNPDITLRRDGNVVHTYIAHDRWCSHPSQKKGRDA